ncbi:DUF4387 domain-containing protein [Streptomyces sp. NPDC002577]
MTRLRDLAKLIRSKNAGPFELTFDVMFEDEATYRRVVDSGALTADSLQSLLKVDKEKIRLFHYSPANSIKVTIPRAASSGDPLDSDLFGGQQFAALVDVTVD